MSYPEEVVHGAGDPRFQGLFGVIEMPHPSELDIDFRPERSDGGSTQVILDSGEILPRADGWRPVVMFEWRYLTLEQYKNLQTVVNEALKFSIKVKPHDDVNIDYDMMIDPSQMVMVRHPGGLYIGHTARVTFVGTKMIEGISNLSGDGSVTGTFRRRMR